MQDDSMHLLQPEEMKLGQLAGEIATYLQKFEHDPTVNTRNKYGTMPYYNTHAWVAGRYVQLRYISYQHTYSLEKRDAIKYLEWLRAGNIGRHTHVPGMK